MAVFITTLIHLSLSMGVQRKLKDVDGLTSIQKEQSEWERDDKETCFLYEGGLPLKELIVSPTLGLVVSLFHGMRQLFELFPTLFAPSTYTCEKVGES